MTSIPPAGDGPPSAQPAFPPAPPPAGDGPASGEPAFPAAPPRPEGNARWKPWTAPIALIAWLFTTLILTLAIALVAAAMGYSLEKPPSGVNIAGVFAQDLAMIGTVLIFASFVGRLRSADLGLLRVRIGKAAGAMLAVWLGFFVFSVIWKAAISLDDPQTLPDELGIDGSTINLVLVVVIIAVLAPLGEELLFRGYVFASLRNWQGFLPAAIVTGLIFGAVHIGSSPIGYALPLAAFGFGLCVLYQWTGSLYPCIALHALNNAFALGIDQGWGWGIAPVMVGAATVSVGLAALLARALASRADRTAGPLPAPAP